MSISFQVTEHQIFQGLEDMVREVQLTLRRVFLSGSRNLKTRPSGGMALRPQAQVEPHPFPRLCSLVNTRETTSGTLS